MYEIEIEALNEEATSCISEIGNDIRKMADDFAPVN